MTRAVGVVGTGMLGAAVAIRLINSGFEVAIYNRTASRMDPVRDAGGIAESSPAGVARRSEVVLSVVRDAEAVRAVSFGKEGILSGKHPGMVVADMSTILPAESRKIHAEFLSHGVDWLDTPVMGGPDAAAAGSLVLMAGGDPEPFRRADDVFAAVAKQRHHLGPPGTAHSVKLSMNLQIAMLALSISEGICLARGLGVDPSTFLDILNSTYFATGMSRKKALRMVRGRYPATFTLENLAKDLATISEAADNVGMRLPMSSEALRVYRAAVRGGTGHLDYTGILEYIQKRSGLRTPVHPP